jgi:hypothetical protein
MQPRSGMAAGTSNCKLIIRNEHRICISGGRLSPKASDSASFVKTRFFRALKQRLHNYQKSEHHTIESLQV